MLCPVCSHRVAADAAACPRCGTNFRTGNWRPLEERRDFPGPGRVGLQAIAVAVVSAVLALLVAAIANPPRMEEGGLSLGWLVAALLHLASVGVPLFVALCGVGLVFVVVRARRRGFNR